MMCLFIEEDKGGMKGWKKINTKDMKKITGGGFWITFWTLSLATLVIGRTLFAKHASVTLNGVGRASWDSKEKNQVNTTSKTSGKKEENNSLIDLENFYTKFYEV